MHFPLTDYLSDPNDLKEHRVSSSPWMLSRDDNKERSRPSRSRHERQKYNASPSNSSGQDTVVAESPLNAAQQPLPDFVFDPDSLSELLQFATALIHDGDTSHHHERQEHQNKRQRHDRGDSVREEKRQRSCFVRNIDYAMCNEHDMVDCLELVGPVLELKILRNRETEIPNGTCIVVYIDEATASSCVRNLNNWELGNRRIVVQPKD